MPGFDFAHVQDEVNMHILRMFEGSFFAWRGPHIGPTKNKKKKKKKKKTFACTYATSSFR